MCGICGIVDFTGKPIEPAVVNRVRDTMKNRGPDDAGTQVLPYVGLGHRRLSIIDLSSRARQPMTNEDGSVWLVFNGEIYDFEPTRRRLEDAGHRFSSDSDSEVLVHGYEEWGIEGLAKRLNGMFAFGLWDARLRQLFLVRDRLGKKPLYYGWCDGRFAFASELKALWMLAPGRWTVRTESIARFMYWTYIPGRETVYQDLYQVLPAHIVTVRDNGCMERRYWQLSFSDKVNARFGDVLDETDAVLTAAVRRRLRSDVPLGAFLSGGVDSGYVVSRMAVSGPVRTFSMGTADVGHDERHFAREVAAHCGSMHTEFEVTENAWALLPRLVWEFGQPFGDSACIPTFYVAQQARAHVTVALTGDGGDEAFAGYSQHRGRQLGAWLASGLPTSVLDLLLRASAGLRDERQLTTAGSAARFLRYAHVDPLVNWGGASNWALQHLEYLWSAEHSGLADRSVLLGHALAVDAEFDGRGALDRALHHDLGMLLPFCYNVKLDVATMMSSLEARCPFQDREVIQWATRLPPGLQIRHGEAKAVLRAVARRWLPRHVIDRPKRGFTVPIDEWIGGQWSNAIYAVIFSERARERGLFDYAYLTKLWNAHRSGAASHGQRFWCLLWLEVWFRMFIDCVMRPEDALPLDGAAECVRPRAQATGERDPRPEPAAPALVPRAWNGDRTWRSANRQDPAGAAGRPRGRRTGERETGDERPRRERAMYPSLHRASRPHDCPC